MPAGNIYGSHLDSRDLIADFYPRLESVLETIWAPLISVEIPSDRAVEEYAWLGQVPILREWQGERTGEVLNKYSLSIRNTLYEATLPISVDDLRRDKTGILRTRVGDLATRTATHWNELLGTFITNGEAGTSGLAYDGQFFFDTDHGESGTSQTNDLTATEVPSANVNTTTTLTSTEAANIINETVAYMMSFTDDKGEPVNQGATDILILCTRPGHFAGLNNAVNLNNLSTGTDNNPVLALRARGFNIRVEYVAQRITAADKLYFFFGSPQMGGSALIRQTEVEPTVQIDMSDEFKKNVHYFGVKALRGVGYGMWARAALVTLS
jgi:phage major head subunit gpT-like protein